MTGKLWHGEKGQKSILGVIWGVIFLDRALQTKREAKMASYGRGTGRYLQHLRVHERGLKVNQRIPFKMYRRILTKMYYYGQLYANVWVIWIMCLTSGK